MQQFLNNYYNKTDLFYLFFLNREDNKKSYMRYTGLNRKNLNTLLNDATIKNKNGGYDIYFSLNSFQFIDKKIHRTKKHVKEVKSIYFDIDEDSINIKNTITSIPLFSNPTYTIQTSQEKYQLIYILENPLTENFNEFEQILKFLTKYFNTDKTFDISRIFRVPNLVNNKNGFEVNYRYSDNKIDFEEVKKHAIDNGFIFEDELPKVKTTKKKKQPIKKAHRGIKSLKYDITQYDDIEQKFNREYDYLLRKYNYDNSTADLAYCRYLVFNKQIKKDSTIIKKLIIARGYEDLISAHPYIDDYLENILIKCKIEEP
ncbi:MAG: DNA-primase RepB domain-containing protein [Campylobacterota bacterium]|nr:DNA-primase RepB domain-containing protein [Campylobacterota bacterium]